MLVDTQRVPTPFTQQLRGKKKVAKAPSTIKVKLLEDIKCYGRRGSIIPVAPGRMRNIWHPQHKALYLTDSQLKELGDVVAERDFMFGMEELAEKEEEEEKMVEVQMKLLSPKRATEIMAAVVPPELIFYRTPIVTHENESPAESPKIIQTPDIQTLLQSSAKPKPKLTTIYGSVSTADISESVKSILALHEEGSRIVLGPEDVQIVEDNGEVSGFEPERIKALGSFRVDIHVKGGEAMPRTVVVKAQEDSEPEPQG